MAGVSEARRKEIEAYQKEKISKLKEPDPKDITDIVGSLHKALKYYYLQDFSGIKQRSWVVEYMKRMGYSTDNIKIVSNLEEKYFVAGHPHTSLMRLCILGYQPIEKHVKMMEDKISWYISKKEEKKYVAQKANDESKRILADIKNREFTSFIDQEIDNIIEEKPREFFATEYVPLNDITKPMIQYMFAYVNNTIKQYEEIKKSKDQEVLECYSHILHNGKISKILAFLYDTKASLEKLLNIQSQKAKVTVNKDADPTKVLKNFKYKFSGSVPSDRLIGSKNVIAYNAKYGVLYYYKAKDSDGMTVRGASLVNYNPETSFAKRIGYKVKDKEAYIEKLKKLNLGQFMTEIENATKEKYFTDSSPKPTGSFNTDTMIVAVIN